MSVPTLHLRSSSGMYGAEQMLLGLCSEQARRGPQPVLTAFAHAGPGPALLDAAEQRGLHTLSLPCRGAFDLACVSRLREHLRALPPHAVLHCHDYKSVSYGYLASRGLGLKRIATVHGWVDDGPRARLYRELELKLLRGFDRVCAVSDSILGALRDAGLREQRIARIDNGIELGRFPAHALPLRSADNDGGTVRIGTAARLSPEKNLGQLIRAVSAARAHGHVIELTIHGEGPLRAELQALIEDLCLTSQVRMPGARGALEDWYPTLDALLLPSLSEGMPMAVLEALACGCPVIASAVGALPEVLRDLPNCQVIPVGDGAALTAALCDLRPRESIDARLRARVDERYSVARMADAYAEVYQQALAA